VSVVARKRVAVKAQRQRAWRKEQSRFGKWLLILEDKAAAKNNTDGVDWHNDHLFTRMRYVSESELSAMRSIITSYKPAGTVDGDWWRRIGMPVDVLRMTTTYGCYDGRIEVPGHYRVEPTKPGDSCFARVCASGMPTFHTNHTHELVLRAIRDHEAPGRERGGLVREENYINGLRRVRHIAAVKDEIAKSSTDKSARQFFAAIAMCGAVVGVAQFGKTKKQREVTHVE
jgi:hypothetical protein